MARYSLVVLRVLFSSSRTCLCDVGKFDYVGSSHQWWHIIAVILFIWWHDSGLQLLTFRLSHPCHT